ncbi:uncharacterized protein MICPUCDRAFT_52302 [Micromonas pusilla CCMP1545]|uniref:Predicted protein n=1 Tax=Micromonas pusilla (strain CCMP1545) TaxID=564608 RepID=C1N3U6_MICPC|nr:uncharacterized protein MICPUCDRAFT_52302 [Micromonas pusilla CCMP1545]EEH53496.1 predicted protein [Micromonas pusilla CCMP1545]|eukprot:XP_003062677.1 predicted protein [Micromonas pusilla CCMP1545]
MFASIAINVVVPAASSRASARGATRARPVAPLASSLASKNPLSERTGASLGDRRAFARRRASSLRARAGDDREGSVGGGTGDNGRMHVPTDAFGGMSPEYKAASALKSLFTMVAVRIVMAQEAGYDNEGGAMTPTYKGLQDYLQENPLRDGNKWLEALMRHEDNNMRLTALRVLEVRKAYAEGQFDFKGMSSLAVEELTTENDKLMADYVKDSMSLPSTEGMGMDGA